MFAISVPFYFSVFSFEDFKLLLDSTESLLDVAESLVEAVLLEDSSTINVLSALPAQETKSKKTK